MYCGLDWFKKFQEFLIKLGQNNINLKFTMSYSNEQIDFLDTTLILQEDG